MRKSAELPIEGIPLCCCLWDCEFGKISLSLRFSSGSIICNGKIRKKNGISRLRRLKDGQMEPYWNKLCLMCSWAEIGSFLLIKVHSIITKKKIFGLIPKSSTQKTIGAWNSKKLHYRSWFYWSHPGTWVVGDKNRLISICYSLSWLRRDCVSLITRVCGKGEACSNPPATFYLFLFSSKATNFREVFEFSDILSKWRLFVPSRIILI